VPRSPGDAAREDGERIRVCTYCFQRWLEEEAAVRGDMAAQQPSSPSMSAASVGSDKSSFTGTNGQMSSYANVSYTDFASMPVHGEGKCGEDDGYPEKKQTVMEPAPTMEPAAYGDNSSDTFNFCVQRYGSLCSLRNGRLTRHIIIEKCCYVPLEDYACAD
jgi:1-phosphatidylinositol-3-phosphate 5-kinase